MLSANRATRTRSLSLLTLALICTMTLWPDVAQSQSSRPSTALTKQLQLLTHSTGKTRINAAVTLGKMGRKAKAAVPALILALKDKYWRVRFNSAESLGMMGKLAEKAIPTLQATTRDKNRLVRWQANKALQTIRKDPTTKLPRSRK